MQSARLVSCTNIDQGYLEYMMKQIAGDDNPTEFLKMIKQPEGLMVYFARVSSPNQTNPSYSKLLEYCAKHAHWSVFEMIDVTFEIETTIPISAQLLRHKSFVFQQFSARYAEVQKLHKVEARRQDKKNRQNSTDDLETSTIDFFNDAQEQISQLSQRLYKESIDKGVAKECARFLLPQLASTRMYMKGSLRSWIHYLEVRCHESTQKEHRDLANLIKDSLKVKFPTVAASVGW